MSNSIPRSIKTRWKRALSMLLVLLSVLGMLPTTALAAEWSPTYPATGDFEVNIAGSTGWNAFPMSLPVYDEETDGEQIATIPALSESAPVAFVILEDNGGDRVEIGLAYDDSGSLTSWEGGSVSEIGWVDKESIFVNLPDVLPSIAYRRTDSKDQYSARLGRYEYIVPCWYTLAEYLAKAQKEAMANGETLLIYDTGDQTADINLAKGDPADLHTYEIDGAVYQKYESWTDTGLSGRPEKWQKPFSVPANITRSYSTSPYTAFVEVCGMGGIQFFSDVMPLSDPTGGTGGLNPGSAGGQKPTTNNVAWTTDQERTFLRFTLIEFPEGVVTDLNKTDYNTWHVVGHPLNVVWGKGKIETWDAAQCRSNITWFNSCALQFNGKGSNAPDLMGGTVYSYDATAGENQRWVTTADEFQAESGITDQQKEQMFHCNSSSWSTGWMDGDYTSMWGTEPESVTPGNPYKVYKANDAFIYLLGRLTETGTAGSGWSRDDAIDKWSEYIHDADGNLRTKYRIIVETGGIVVDPDGIRRAYTLREMMAYSLYNNESASSANNLIYDQSSTIKNMSRWMRQSKDNQFVEYPLKADGTPTGEELHSTNGFREADSFVDSITSPSKIRSTIFDERRSYGLHIFSPFNFESSPPTGNRVTLDVTKSADAALDTGDGWGFTVLYTAGSPASFTAKKNGADCKSEVTETGSGLTFKLKAGETIHFEFEADSSFRCEVTEDDTSNLTNITGTGGTADMSAKKFTSDSGEAKVTFTNGTTISEKKPVYLKLKKIAAADKKPLAGAVFSVYADSSCSGTPLATMTSGSDGTAITSVPNIVEDGGSVTLYVKETTAPAGCTPLGTPFTVTCKAPENSTEAGAVQVGPAEGIENGGEPDGPDGPILYKRDAMTNSGVGPATFKFASVVNGDYEFTTNANGELEPIQWWNPTDESKGRYIKPGEYTVTEIVPPPNYMPTTEVQQIKLELDDSGNGIPAGPLVFKNLAKVGLKIIKYDRQSHAPMAGVSFEIFKDGVSIGRRETNANGEILLTDIEPGTYRVVEVDTGDDSHILDSTAQEIELIAGMGTKELIFYNDKKPGMKLVKVDSSDPSKTIPGAKFRIRAVDGSFGPQEFVTDANGEIDLSKLPEGSYEVTEIECAGYVIDDAQRIIHLHPNDTAEFVFTNTKKPVLRLIKTSADGTPLDGVTFRIAPVEDGSRSLDRTTQNGGEILIEDLDPGVYSVQEIATLPDHVLDKNEYHVELSPGKTAEIRLKNDKRPNLTIWKRDADTKEIIPNTIFLVKAADGHSINEVKTGADGKGTLENLLPGVYEISEKSVPDPWLKDAANQLVTLYPNVDREVVFENHKKPLLTLSKIDADTGDPVPGTVFTVEGIDNDYQDDWTTGADGKVSLRVPPGTYRVTEKSVPAPYFLPDKDADRVQTITLNGGDEKTLLFKNHKAPELTIYKEDSVAGAPIEGAKFHVTYTSNGEAADAPASIDFGYFFTDANGQIKLHEKGKKLYPGEYTITEVEPAPGFQMKEPTTQRVIIRGGESKTVTFQNEPLNAIIVEKYDSVTHAALPGCTFQLRFLGGTSGTGGTVIGQKVTGQNGTCIWTGLTAGTYIVEEISPADGYSIINSSETVYISDNGTQSVVTVKFDNAPDGILLIRKVCAVNPSITLQDAEFKVMYADGTLIGDSNGIYRTDENGEIRIEGLKPGKSVIVTETKAPDGFIIDTQSQTIQIKEGRTVSLTFKNQPKGSLIIQKRDSITGQPLPGAEFRVTTAAGCEVGLDGVIGSSTLTQNGLFTTDSNGEIRISNLAPGALVLTEVRAPDGYVMDSPSTNVVIGTNGDTQTVVITNTPKGGLLIRKVDSVTGKALPGVKFKITAANGELVPDNEGLTSSNGLYTTDENGQIYLRKLNPNTYVVTEVETIDGYLLNAAPQTVVVSEADTQVLTFTNMPLGGLLVKKMDSATKEPLADVIFKITRTDGTVVGNSNGEYRTDERGFISLPDLEPGSYIVREVQAKPGYLLDDTPHAVEIKDHQTYTLEVFNQPLGNLIINKLSSLDNSPLEGVKFQIKYANGQVVDNKNGQVSSNGIYYTDRNGQIILSGITGAVVVTELETIPGYRIDPNTRTQTVVVNPNDTQTINFYNTPTTTLIIRKFIEGTENEPLSGVAFRVVDGAGAAVGPDDGLYYTDKSGEIVLTGIEPGTVVIAREVKTVEGYVLDGTPQDIKIEAGHVQQLTFWNKKAGTLVIQKKDKVSGALIAGAEFQLTYANGGYVDDDNGHLSSNGIYTTNDKGEIRVSGVVGTIVAKELKPAPGYVIDSATQTQTVTVNPMDTQTLTFLNDPLCSLTLTKLDSVTGKPVPNTEFTVKDGDGNVLGRYVTGKDGTVVVTGLIPGSTVVVSESRVPDGYVLDTTPQTIIVKNGTGNSYTSGVTNTGTPSGSGNGNGLTFENDPKVTLTIHKYIEGTANEPLAGVAFKVTDGSGAPLNPDGGIYYTNNAGEIVLEGLEPGATITAQEVKTVDGFVLDGRPQSIKIEAGKGQSLTFWNKRAGSLIIRKLDKQTGKPLAGVEFELVYAEGGYVDTDNGHLSSKGLYTTDDHGEIHISGITGTVIVKETRPLSGYTIEPGRESQTVTVNPQETQTLTFYNIPANTLTIEKYVEGTNEPLKGVTFLVTDSNGGFVGKSNGEYVTDENGRIEITGLTPGENITVKEVKTLEGYVLDSAPKSIKITEGEAHTLKFYNQRQGTLVIRKLDKLTGEPLSGVEFELTYANGGYVDADNGHLSSKGLYTTDSNGEIQVSGITGTIVIKETKCLPGYTMDPATSTQTVTVNPADTQTITVYNTPGTTLTIQKYIEGTNNEPLAGVTFLVTDSGGTPLGPNKGEYITDRNGQIVLTDIAPGTTITAKEVKTVEGFVMDGTPQSILIKEGQGQQLTFFNTRIGGLTIIKKDEETGERISGVQFEIRKMNGEIIGTYTTDRNGVISLPQAEKGWYQVTELKAAKGYRLDSQPHQIEVKDGGTATLEITNRQAGSALIHKVDSLTGEGIYGVKFLVSDAKGNPIGTYQSDNEGYVYIDKELADGKYTIREIECASGYILDTQPKTFYVEYGGCTTITWPNTAMRGQIQIVKKSADYNPTNGLPAGTLLAGATFEIYNERTGNKVDTIVTGANGLASSKQLPLGRYTIRETKAPANYGASTDTYTAVLEYSGQIVKLEISNKALSTGVSIEKTGPKEATSGQPVRYVFSKIGNSSNVMLQSFYWRDSLPAAVRLDKVVTGTYNFPGTYKIVYKVNNTGDYRTLADSLSTSQNYTLAASPNALGLASNERVTEIMFVFGQAPAGFSQVEAPMLYCTAVSGLTAGSSFVNVADVGGTYNGVWIQAVSRWETKVYGKPTPLPRTGY